MVAIFNFKISSMPFKGAIKSMYDHRSSRRRGVTCDVGCLEQTPFYHKSSDTFKQRLRSCKQATRECFRFTLSLTHSQASPLTMQAIKALPDLKLRNEHLASAEHQQEKKCIKFNDVAMLCYFRQS